MYHITSIENLAAIAANGLEPRLCTAYDENIEDTTPYIYCSLSYTAVQDIWEQMVEEGMRSGTYAILRLSINKKIEIEVDPYSVPELDSFRIRVGVPAHRIKVTEIENMSRPEYDWTLEEAIAAWGEE